MTPRKKVRDVPFLVGRLASIPRANNPPFQTPPDLVVKFQLIDIVIVILWLVLRLLFVYQRQIGG
jgi:hypothetical protein